MSKFEENKILLNNNYFSNPKEVYDLIKMILKEMYSKDISDVGMDLLYNGASTLYEIQLRLRLSFENIRNYLIVMLQNSLIQKSEIKRNEAKLTVYEIKTEQILNILFFPRILNFIEKKYGNYGKMIFEQFLEYGVLTMQQIVDLIQKEKKNVNGNNYEYVRAQVIELFLKLYENDLIIYSERAVEEENYYSPVIKSNNLKKEESKKIQKSVKNSNEKNGKSNKKKKNAKESKRNKTIKLNEDEEEDEYKEEEEERILDIVDKSQNGKNSKSEEFYENNTKNNMHFYINFDQIIAEFKSEIVIDYINNNISHAAALLAGELLKKHIITSFKLGETPSIQIDNFLNTHKSFSSSQIEEIIKNNKEIFKNPNSEEIYLDLAIVKKEIKTKTIKMIIETKFSPEHFRVYNLLNLVGTLDNNNIIDLCLLEPDKIKLIINQLYQEGYIRIEPNDYNRNDTLYFSVDEHQTCENILKMDYIIINNYKSYYNEQINSIKNKFTDNKKQNEDLIKLTYIIDQIYENIIIMKYF